MRLRKRLLSPGARAFTLAELLVVIGIISLLIALVAPSLRLARDQAMAAQCASCLQQLGHALEAAHTEFQYYPTWDDGGSPQRYTWIDVLIQRKYSFSRAAYCANDARPDFLNEARGQSFGVVYPDNPLRFGIDHSFGISVPLASGAWNWHPGIGDGRPRRFVDHDRDPSRRVLSADANWSGVYNLSGEAVRHRIWNSPTQFDNTVAYRHANFTSNLLLQDGHVSRMRYRLESSAPVDTVAYFVWHADENLFVGPEDQFMSNFYPAYPITEGYPAEMSPDYYTENRLWSSSTR